MRLSYYLLPLAAVTAAFMIPDEEVLKQIDLEAKDPGDSIFEEPPPETESPPSSFIEYSESALDSALSFAGDVGRKTQKGYWCTKSLQAFDVNAWLATGMDVFEQSELSDQDRPPHHRPPRRCPLPHHSPQPPPPPHHGPHPPHRRPHHGYKSNLTLWQLISKSKYTTKLAKLISEDKDLVHLLDSTEANHTVFAPVDAAFRRIPKHGKKPPKKFIEKVLKYHVVPGRYPAGRVIGSHTIPTILNEPTLGMEPQRLRVGFSLRGLDINFFSQIKAFNIIGTNGIIHAVDHIILPPPPALKIIELLPGEFSTLQLGLLKTGLFEEIEKSGHIGGTLFAPSNFAFKKLGPAVNGFLFSKYGLKYLRALLEYHIVPDTTLYSDALYRYKPKNDEEVEDTSSIPRRGRFHIDLPTLLHGKHLSIDIARWGRFINFMINGFNRVTVLDGVAMDGVIHVVPSVLIPPKTPGGKVEVLDGELTVEELVERLSPFVESGDGGEL